MKDDKIFVEHILEMIEKIEQYVANVDFAHFSKHEILQDAVVRKLEIIGEAAGKISGDFRDAHPEVPWREMIGMRNKIIHDYLDVDLEIVWNTVKESLPDLKLFLKKL